VESKESMVILEPISNSPDIRLIKMVKTEIHMEQSLVDLKTASPFPGSNRTLEEFLLMGQVFIFNF